jgi:hypothetical protein
MRATGPAGRDVKDIRVPALVASVGPVAVTIDIYRIRPAISIDPAWGNGSLYGAPATSLTQRGTR